MNRTKALANALSMAQSSGTIIVLYQGNDNTWHCQGYALTRDLIDYRVETTRYVLPHGEVTKLS